MNMFAHNIKLHYMFLAYIFSCMNSFFQSTAPLSREVSIIIASVFTSGYYISNPDLSVYHNFLLRASSHQVAWLSDWLTVLR